MALTLPLQDYLWIPSTWAQVHIPLVRGPAMVIVLITLSDPKGRARRCPWQQEDMRLHCVILLYVCVECFLQRFIHYEGRGIQSK